MYATVITLHKKGKYLSYGPSEFNVAFDNQTEFNGFIETLEQLGVHVEEA